jgi:lysophospholipase L1-like esterase
MESVMRAYGRLIPALFGCCSLIVVSATLAVAEDKPQNAAVVPASKVNEDWWKKRHESFNERAKQGNVDLLLIGDSITHGWEGDGKSVWESFYTKRNAMNLGIGGDRTQHVLWRLDNGNIDGLKPKAAVLMIGTNNSNGNDNTAEEIGAGIQAIVKKLREKLPDTKVLILAVFPRGEKPNPQRDKNAKASEIAAQLADNQNVFYLDIGPKFLQDDGTLSKEIMPDLLHLSPKGYEIWATAIEDRLADMMGEKK